MPPHDLVASNDHYPHFRPIYSLSACTRLINYFRPRRSIMDIRWIAIVSICYYDESEFDWSIQCNMKRYILIGLLSYFLCLNSLYDLYILLCIGIVWYYPLWFNTINTLPAINKYIVIVSTFIIKPIWLSCIALIKYCILHSTAYIVHQYPRWPLGRLVSCGTNHFSHIYTIWEVRYGK
jgi:hypothetical protein